MKKFTSFLLVLLMIFPGLSVVNAEEKPTFIIEPKYENAKPFSEGLAAVVVDGKYGFIDKTGKMVIEPKYPVNYGSEFNDSYIFQDGVAAVMLNGKFGYIDRTGKEIVKPQYDRALPFENGLGRVIKGDLLNGNKGWVDKTGKEVIKPQYQVAFDFSEGLAMVQKNKMSMVDIINGVPPKSHFIDKTGKIIFTVPYSTGSFHEGLAVIIDKNGKHGFINKAGKVVIKPQYDSASDFSEDLAAVEKGGKWSYINKQGKTVLNVKYAHVGPFVNGLAKFQNSEVKDGYINKSGKEVVKANYDRLGEFINGFAIARPQKSSAYVVIDQSGKEILTLQGYSSVYGFSEGLAFVRKGDSIGFVDKKGKVYNLPFSDARSFSDGLAAVKVNGKWGFIASPIDTVADWAKEEVDQAVEIGLVPDNIKYGYAQNITREEFSRLVVHLLTVKTGKTMEELLTEHGLKVNHAAFKDTNDFSVLAANAFGIVNGKAVDKFDPTGLITREEAATMLTRTAKVLGINGNHTSTNFADNNKIASWAKESVAFVSSAKDHTNNAFIMGGTGVNQFSPKANYTRQQAFITMKRLFNVE